MSRSRHTPPEFHAHGAGLAVVLPAWMACTAGRGPARAARIARFVRDVLGVSAADDAEAAAEGAARLKAWFARIGAPTSMAAAGIASPDLERLADLAVKLTKRWGIADHARADILAVYRACR
jgi:NADP-dependent alcohol dehydrogenase